MAIDNYNHFVAIVAGDNPELLMSPYDKNIKTEPKVVYKYKDAAFLRNYYISLYEGFGIPVIEAQRAGCPVIAQNHSSIPEVIGEKGLMVQHDTPQRMAAEMADIVRQLQSRPIQDMIEAGFENARRFSWDKTYQQVKQVYENINHNYHL